MKLLSILSFLLLFVSFALSLEGEPSFKEKINQFVGRDLFVDPSDIDGKIHEWGDVKRWFPPRGKDPLRMGYPESLLGSGKSEQITVRIIITPEGKAINPEIIDLKNREMAIPALLHVAQMKFQVPKKDGEPIYLQQKIKLICSEDPEFGKKE